MTFISQFSFTDVVNDQAHLGKTSGGSRIFLDGKRQAYKGLFIGRSKCGTKDAHPRSVQFLSFSCSFRKKILSNNRFLAQTRLVPTVWEILHPPSIFPITPPPAEKNIKEKNGQGKHPSLESPKLTYEKGNDNKVLDLLPQSNFLLHYLSDFF